MAVVIFYLYIITYFLISVNIFYNSQKSGGEGNLRWPYLPDWIFCHDARASIARNDYSSICNLAIYKYRYICKYMQAKLCIS